jgi:hypothetical protein
MDRFDMVVDVVILPGNLRWNSQGLLHGLYYVFYKQLLAEL